MPEISYFHHTPHMEAEIQGILQCETNSWKNFIPRAIAGYMQNEDPKPFYENAERVEIEGFTENSPHGVFRIRDNAMSPTLEPGDLLLCSRLEHTADIPSGSILVVRSSKEMVIRRFFSVNGRLLLQSDNREYKVYNVDKGDMTELWKVKKKLSLADMQNLASDHDPMAYLERDVNRLKQQLEVLMEKLKKR